MQIEVQNLLGDNMEMSYNKCIKCNYANNIVTGNSILIICTVSGREIEINDCIKEHGDLLMNAYLPPKREKKEVEKIKKSLLKKSLKKLFDHDRNYMWH